MKKCPFCAEEIQDAAIKCRFCGEFLSTAPPSAATALAPAMPAQSGAPAGAPEPAPTAAAPEPAPEPAPAVAPAPAAPTPTPAAQRSESAAPFSRAASSASADDEGAATRNRKVLYSGYPSWRAFLKEYVLVLVASILTPLVLYWLGSQFDASNFTLFLLIAIPLAMGGIAFMAVTFYRRSKIIRVTTTNIETEHGILARKIDVLELWRCRDVRYKQSLLDRILGIAHIEIYTADVTTPQLEIVGLPASRQLFESVRDSIEIQRQSRNVYGVIS